MYARMSMVIRVPCESLHYKINVKLLDDIFELGFKKFEPVWQDITLLMIRVFYRYLDLILSDDTLNCQASSK